MASPAIEIEVDDKVVRVTNPDRVYFPARGETKLDLVEYYLSVGDGIVNALRERPCMLHRFPTGVTGEKVHQKRIPASAPPWVETVQVFFPRWKRTADELCVTELAQVIWAVQMSTVEFHPWNSRRDHVEEPDEWRIDLDPGPECDWARVQRVAHVAHSVLDDLGAVGYPKTSGGRGIHIYVRIPPQQMFVDAVKNSKLKIASISGTDRSDMETGTFVQSGKQAIIRDALDGKTKPDRWAGMDYDEMMRTAQLMRENGPESIRSRLGPEKLQSLKANINTALTDPRLNVHLEDRQIAVLKAIQNYADFGDRTIGVDDMRAAEGPASKVPRTYDYLTPYNYSDPVGPG